jgi:hypothetical protein
MNELELTPEEYAEIAALGETIGVLGQILTNGSGSPETLRMAVAVLRNSANVFENVLRRWETELDTSNRGANS